jgi:hypothetical protein
VKTAGVEEINAIFETEAPLLMNILERQHLK